MNTNHTATEKPHVTIDMVHDLVCSWCPIGYTHLSNAVSALADEITVSVNFVPFQLNPSMPYEGEEIEAHLMRRTGQTKEQLVAYRKNLIATGKAAGFEFDFTKRTHYYNSLKGHLLLNAAHEVGKQRDVISALHRAYHKQGGNLADDEVIYRAGRDAGLDDDFIRAALEGEENRQDTLSGEDRARTRNVRSVPTFFIGDSVTLPGSNSVAFFTDNLQKIAASIGKAA